MTKPNLLLIMVDEMQAAAMSCAGHPFVQTPHIDRLAARGCRFTNAYTPDPICVPARAVFATGRHVFQIGNWDNAIAYDGRVPGWGHVLQDAGMEPVSIGKLHYRAEEDPTGFTRQILPMHIYKGIGQVWSSIRDPLPSVPHTKPMINGIGPGLSKYNQYDLSIADATVDWLRNAPDGPQPWTLFSSYVAPHFPFVVPQEYLDLYPPEEMPFPELRPGSGYERHPWLERMDAFQPCDNELRDDDERRLAVACYFGLCTFVDAQVGKVLNALEESGQAERTLVLFTSDHGETLGRRGRWGKSVLYGDATRVPLIMAGPGIAPGTLCETPVSLLDVPPTVTDALGLETPEEWEGRSLLELLGQEDDLERGVFSEYHAIASPTGAFMLADARWKYHEYVDYPPELFDLESDPGETRNLAGDAGYARIASDMRGRLLDICDPVAVDRAAKDDQNALIARHGGPEAASRVGVPGATPVPD